MQFGKVDKKKLILVIFSVIMMGFSLTFLNQTNFGTDPYTVLNLGIASKIGLSLGNSQAIFNCALLVIVFLFDKRQIGWGTIANMFLIGYSFDFFTWLNGFWFPQEIYQSLTGRILVMIPSLCVFILVAATYMAVQLGTSPYDAVPFIISTKLPKVPFRIIRIIWDILACVIGVLLGSKLGVVTVVMAFVLGPVITWVKTNIVERYLTK
ncbi:MAG: hypothetical protein E7291_09860 [Lachnospiraceae bacterium]|nr:hypothetical protein [Lachnospiraceae bacterium]